jgi:hydrogenase-4 component B
MPSTILSVLVIVVGGFIPLFFWRNFDLMKMLAVPIMAAGCLLGLVNAGMRLYWLEFDNAAWSLHLNAFTLSFQIDSLSAFFLVAIYAICLIAAVYSFHYLSKPAKALRAAVSYLFFSLLTGAMVLVVCADNLVTFMLCWEIMSLSSFFLVIYDFEADENRKAGLLYFVFSQAGAMLILVAFGVMAAHTGSFDFGSAADLPPVVKLIVFSLAFVGFGSKAGVFPFHAWLPHAHPAAPSHISAVMSGVMIKTGIYGILRIYVLLDWQTPVFGNIVLAAGMISGVLGVVYALGQHDLKRLLAYSSVENIGIILIGIGIGMIGAATGRPVMALLGFSGGLLHVLNHSIFKSLLFMGAGVVLQKTGTRTMDVLGGLMKKMKVTGASFLIGSLAISGLPPFNGFVSEFVIYMGGFQGLTANRAAFALSLLAIISLAIIGGLALACFSKVVGVVFQGEPRSRVPQNLDEKGATMLVSMVVLAAACIIIGVFPRFFMVMAVNGASILKPGPYPAAMETIIQMTGDITRVAAVFFAVVLVLLVLRTLAYRGKPVSRAGTWGCGFTQPTVRMQYTAASYADAILAFFRPVAPLEEDHPPIRGCFPAPTHYHSHIEDIAERHTDRMIVRPVLALFDKLRWLQHGDIHLYIGYILLAIVALLFFI